MAQANPQAGQAPMQPQGQQAHAGQGQQQKLQEVLQKNPQMIKQVVQEIQASGITPQDLQKLYDASIQCLDNPKTYPQLRQLALQDGVAEQDLPKQFDSNFLASIAISAQLALQHMQSQPQQQLQMPKNL